MATEWITPKPFAWLAKQVMGGIDLDPASSERAQQNVEARAYYTPEQDGLQMPWLGRVWLSPPTGRHGCPDFTGKLIEEYASGRVTEAIVLVPNAGDTVWHHRLCGLHMPVCTKRGRIRFETPDRSASTPPCGHAFFYLGDQPQRFVTAFRPLGIVSVAETDCGHFAKQFAADRAAVERGRHLRTAAVLQAA